MIKEDKGVISIAMAILIPVIIFGVLYVYTLLDKPKQENRVHKIVYASSEAYLSRYNAYLFNEMGVLANLDSDTLEPLILHYLLRNKCIVSRESVVLDINYEKLNEIATYKEAIVEASTVLIGNAMVGYSIDLLNQFELAEKVRTMNQSIQNYEKKLSEQFDKKGATRFLTRIKLCRDVQTGKREITALKSTLNLQYETYFETIEALKAAITTIKATIVEPKQAMAAFLEAKEAQWRASETEFVTAHQTYLKDISKIDVQFIQLELEEETKRQLAIQIDIEKKKMPLNQDEINRLEALYTEVEGVIARGFDEIHAIASEKLALFEEMPPSIIQTFKELLLEAEYLFSGIEIGSGEIVLKEAFKHSVNNQDEPYVNTSDLTQKATVNEYYLSVFSSYDLRCPRVFDPQNRQKSLRSIKGEVEYLISGLEKEKQSIRVVRLKIFAIRSAANLVTLLCDKDKLTQLSMATVALPQPWRSLVYGAAIVTWSGAESYSDINRLMKGEGLYFLKTQAQWALDYEALLNGSWKTKMTVHLSEGATNDTLTVDNQPTSDEQSNIMDARLYYMDYLRVLLLLQDEKTTLLRAMDLVESELSDVSEGKMSLSNFSRGHVIDVTWMTLGTFGRLSNQYSTLHMRNGFE